MAQYHEADICRYFKDVFGYEGSAAESAAKMTKLFQSFGVDMYFDGEATEEAIRNIDIETTLSLGELTDMMKGCLR